MASKSQTLKNKTGNATLHVERYYWCALCERVYSVHEWKENGGRCPGENCEAPVALRIGWENVRMAHPDYPKIPVRDEYYSMERYRL